jgi:mRNA interferase RelE/StbE
MQVEFLSQFSRDLDKIRFAHIKQTVQHVILRVESAKRVNEIPNLKKLSGHKSAYRIRIGDYRIGIFVDGKNIQFARVVHRKDIYKLFP